MWFLFALLSAVFYSLLWVLARMSRGMPASVVTAVQFFPGPILLLYVVRTIDYPWGEAWWRWYLVFPLVLLPLMLLAQTFALHRTEVTIVKPLFGLSSLATLLIASLFFGERISPSGIAGIIAITVGLSVLYHGRWDIWRRSGPWIVLAAAVVFGVNAAVVKSVLLKFPHVLAVSALMMTATFLVSGVAAGSAWRRVAWSCRNFSILLALAVAMVSQDILTISALALGPSPSVIAVKRTSILFTAVVGYLLLRERDQSLPRLLLAGGLVVIGVVLLVL